MAPPFVSSVENSNYLGHKQSSEGNNKNVVEIKNKHSAEKEKLINYSYVFIPFPRDDQHVECILNNNCTYCCVDQWFISEGSVARNNPCCKKVPQPEAFTTDGLGLNLPPDEH